MGCADVSISPASGSSSGSLHHSYGNNGNTGSALNLVSSLSGGIEQGSQGFVPINVVATVPSNGVTCEAVIAWKARYVYADQWCKAQCQAGNCPIQYCQNGCRILYG